MENKINIAELLKDCPSGMELDSPMYDNLYFDCVEIWQEKTYEIKCYIERGVRTSVRFTKYGQYNKDTKCVIFPKGKTTWEGFVPPCKFKDGDIISNGSYVAIFHKTGKPENCVKSNVLYYHCWYHPKYNEFKGKIDYGIGFIVEYKYATEEEKAKLFQAIKSNGYKWNAETKTLEKLVGPEFKVGDKIKRKDSNEDIVSITDITDDYYIVETEYGMKVAISINIQNNYKLVPSKFDITTLKPFDKVLVRVCDTDKWIGDFYMRYDDTDTEKEFPYNCVGGIWSYCIPYESNEHLLGTTDDCDEYYKNWG